MKLSLFCLVPQHIQINLATENNDWSHCHRYSVYLGAKTILQDYVEFQEGFRRGINNTQEDFGIPLYFEDFSKPK
jgi:hypothetical protein